MIVTIRNRRRWPSLPGSPVVPEMRVGLGPLMLVVSHLNRAWFTWQLSIMGRRVAFGSVGLDIAASPR